MRSSGIESSIFKSADPQDLGGVTDPGMITSPARKVSPEAAKIKGVDSPVAGRADIVVVPNIEMGNGLFKMMVHFMSGLAAGVVMGAKVPIVLTSRADPPEARFAATLIAAILTERNETQPAVK